jgi:hypothetical protein
MALSPFLATGRDELRAVGRIGVDQLPLLRDLRVVGRDEVFFLELSADAFRNLRDGLGLSVACEPMSGRAVFQQFSKVQGAIPRMIGVRLEDHAFDLPKQAIRQAA